MTSWSPWVFLLYIVNSIVNMSYYYITNVCISLDILVILVLYVYNFISNVLVSQDLLVILVLKMFKTKNYNPQAQTTPQNFNISKLKSSVRRIAAAFSGPVTTKPVMGRMELDSHADTIVAGSNCCVIEYTGRECDVSPYSSEYSPVTGVPIVKAATVWQSQLTGQEYLLIFNQALYMPSLSHSLINPNQLRAFGITVQDNPLLTIKLTRVDQKEMNERNFLGDRKS